MTYPFKTIALNRNRLIVGAAAPALDLTQVASKAVSGVAYNFRGTWSASLDCKLGDLVLYGTTMWLAIGPSLNVTPGNGVPQWQSAGSYSAFQGAWSSTTAYVTGDEVSYSDNFWLCVTPNTNSAPTLSNANWQIAGPDNLANVMLPAADANGNWVAGVSTSGATDDAGLGTTAGWATIAGQPTTRAGYGIVDAQGTLPTTSGTRHAWFSDSGGPVYEDSVYGTEQNLWSDSALGIPQLLSTTSTTMVQIGNGDIVIPNPGQQVNIVAIGVSEAYYGGTAGYGCSELQISVNGGSTWTTSPVKYVGLTAADSQGDATSLMTKLNVTPTGDIHIRQMVSSSGAFTVEWQSAQLLAFLLPTATASVVGGTLSVSVPATATASCTAIYPATTCTASKSITATPAGGLLPLSYSWSRTGGTGSGTITSGATAPTCTTSDTQTGTSAGASFTDTYKCVVTDSTTPTPQTANASCTVTSTYYAGYATISPSISVTGGSCSTGTSSGTCAASGTFSVSATGGNGSYTYSNSVYSHDSGFSTNPTIASGATAATGTYSGAATTTVIPGTKLKVTLQTSVNDTRGTGAQTATGSNSLTFKFTSQT